MRFKASMIVDAVIVILIVFLLIANVSGYVLHKPIIAVVRGISMKPLMHTGDLVIINPLDTEPRIGQVVVYVNDIGEYVIHRVVAKIRCSNGETLYVTKGDNDPLIDPEDIAVLKSIRCSKVIDVESLNDDVLKQVKMCLKGLPRRDIIGVVLQLGDSVVKIFGLSPSIG